MKNLKPPLHFLPMPDIPPLPQVKPEDAVAILKNENWSARVIRNKNIKSVREIMNLLLESDSLPQDFDQVVFEGVVIEQDDLTDLEIPFKLYFMNTLFPNGLDLKGSCFKHLNISGHIRWGLNLAETRGQPIINLKNLQADQIYVYKGEGLDCFGISTSTICSITLASTAIKRHITLHDNVDILDGLWLENLSIEREVNLTRCAVQKFFRILNVHCSGDIKLVVCDLNVPLSTRDSSCIKLNLSESNCSGRLDFRNLSFQQLDVSSTSITGQILFNLKQLQRKSYSKGLIVKKQSKWDVPPCLSSQRSYTLQESVSVAEQLITLHNNFKQIPIAEEQERYCAYHLADVTWKPRLGFPLTQIAHWIAKQGFGYLLLPLRIIRTMLAIIGLFACLYILLFGFKIADLVFSDGTSIFNDGFWCSIYRSLYFSIVTFSTLGYGDIHPIGFTKALASMEALAGLVIITLFGVCIARRLFRW